MASQKQLEVKYNQAQQTSVRGLSTLLSWCLSLTAVIKLGTLAICPMTVMSFLKRS